MAKRTQGATDHQDFAVLGIPIPCDAKEAQRTITEIRGLLRQLFEVSDKMLLLKVCSFV